MIESRRLFLSISIFCAAALLWPVTATSQCIAIGATPYTSVSSCTVQVPPYLEFTVSGDCFNACGDAILHFEPLPVRAVGNCVPSKCDPYWVSQNSYNATAREFFSEAMNLNSSNCVETGKSKAAVLCPCPGCTPRPTPNNNTAPGEDPLIISLADTRLSLSSLEKGVKFDLDGDGELEKTAWTAPGSDDAFLALDRNYNGRIDNGLEIFGGDTPQLPSAEPNGFRALAVFDDIQSGGNADGKIDHQDSIFTSLLLWADKNHDGQSAANEVAPLSDYISTIYLGYQRSYSVDTYGNELRYWTRVLHSNEDSTGSLEAWNVFFVAASATPSRK